MLYRVHLGMSKIQTHDSPFPNKESIYVSNIPGTLINIFTFKIENKSFNVLLVDNENGKSIFEFTCVIVRTFSCLVKLSLTRNQCRPNLDPETRKSVILYQ